MFIKPKKIKFDKVHKPKIKFKKKKQITTSFKNIPNFGTFSFFVVQNSYLKSRNFELARRLLQKISYKKCFIWFCCFPLLPFSKKPTGVRIGKGKGLLSFWVTKLSAGLSVIEVSGVSFITAKLIAFALEKIFFFKIKVGFKRKVIQNFFK